MSWYETALVLDPRLEEDGINKRVQRYTDVLTENGATDLRIDRRGMRKLAYNIKGKDGEWRTQADYTFVLYQAPPTTSKEVERQLRLDEDVLRYLTVRYEKLPPTEKPHDDESDTDDADGSVGEEE